MVKRSETSGGNWTIARKSLDAILIQRLQCLVRSFGIGSRPFFDGGGEGHL